MTDRTDDDSAMTTHAEWGSGAPHLLVSRGGEDRFVFDLTEDEVSIGSAEGNGLVLAGTDAVHATIVHDDEHEYVQPLHGGGEMNASTRSAPDGPRAEVLRTGARFTMGDWTLVFGRAEYADHGRPFGGREGGELSDQPPQPERPDYPAERAGEDTVQDQEVKDG